MNANFLKPTQFRSGRSKWVQDRGQSHADNRKIHFRARHLYRAPAWWLKAENAGDVALLDRIQPGQELDPPVVG
jgi:hypothetical protein